VQAQKTGLFDRIAVSSDSEEILEVAKNFGVTNLVKRPDHLATDQAAKIPAIQHCLQSVERESGTEFSTVVDLDATSPLRSIEDIAGAIALLEEGEVSNVITATPARRSPYFNMIQLQSDGSPTLANVSSQIYVRRQDAPRCFDMNASIYVWCRNVLLEYQTLFLPATRVFMMPEERSLDIDSEFDFELVKYLITRKD
jgi:N-acylneuraminate cytidylyltransferase/CMP-N,N'-diacetyllegionaminic acid synthase